MIFDDSFISLNRMKIHFLGTGTGIPRKDRASPSILIEIPGIFLLFDLGPGATRQIIRAGFRLNDINAIFITHFHVDHCGDIPAFLFASNYEIEPREVELLIYGPKGMRAHMENLVCLYGEQIVGKRFVTTVVEIGKDTVEVGDAKINAFKTLHREESVGYSIEWKGKKVVYTGDTDFGPSLYKFLDSADLLITECSLPYKVRGHLTPEEAGKLAEEVGARKLALVHLYPPVRESEVLKVVREFYKGEVIIPDDLDFLEL